MQFSSQKFLDSLLYDGRIEIYAKRTHALASQALENQKRTPPAVFRGFATRRTRIRDLLGAEKRELHIPDEAPASAVVYDPLFTAYERLHEELKAELLLDPYVVTRAIQDLFLFFEDYDLEQFKRFLNEFTTMDTFVPDSPATDDTDQVFEKIVEESWPYDLIYLARILQIAHESFLSGCHLAQGGGRPLTRARENDTKLLKHYVDRVKRVLEWITSLLDQ